MATKQKITKDQGPINEILALKTPPYPPSWLDRLNAWVELLAMPGFVFYVLFYLAVIVTQIAAGYITGYQSLDQDLTQVFLYQLFTLEALYYNYISYGLALDALASFQSLLKTSKRQIQVLKYEFAILPAGKTLGLTVVTVAASIGLAYISPTLFGTSVAINAGYVFYQSLGWVFSLFGAVILVYRLLHQIRRVSRIYELVNKVDLYNLGPIYSLSSFMGKASLILLFILYSNLFSDPTNLGIAGFLQGSLAISIVALAGFVWPLLGINRRLVAEKAKLIQESGRQVRAAFERLNKEQESRNLANMGNTRQLLDAVIRKREYIQNIPTWPWQPGTFRGLLLGVVLPILIWLVQQVLLRTVVK
ncbi:MAG: hypothetical protein WEA61_00480 [Anaerolineales bacterium]